MEIPQWIIDNLKNKLVETLSTLSTFMSCNDDRPYEWAWDADNGTLHMQFSVHINENMDTIYIEIYNYTENTRITKFETDNH